MCVTRKTRTVVWEKCLWYLWSVSNVAIPISCKTIHFSRNLLFSVFCVWRCVTTTDTIASVLLYDTNDYNSRHFPCFLILFVFPPFIPLIKYEIGLRDDTFVQKTRVSYMICTDNTDKNENKEKGLVSVSKV